MFIIDNVRLNKELNKAFIENCEQGNTDAIITALNSDKALNLNLALGLLQLSKTQVENKKEVLLLFLTKFRKNLNMPNIFLNLIETNNLQTIRLIERFQPSDDNYLLKMVMNVCRNNNVEIFHYLLEKFNIKEDILSEGLIVACEFNHMEIVQYLLENSLANIHYRLDYALRVAGNSRNLEIVKYLLTSKKLKVKANPYAVSADLVITAIMNANQELLHYLYHEYGFVEPENVKAYKIYKEEQSRQFQISE